jgi:hypothetical protein
MNQMLNHGFHHVFMTILLLVAAHYHVLAQLPCECHPDSSAQLIEPNWGELRLRGFVDPPIEPPELPDPRYIIRSFAVSPDGRWLAYRAGWREHPGALLLKNLQTGKIRVIARYGYEPQWHPNSRLLMYTDDSRRGREFFNVAEESELQIVGYCDTSFIVVSTHDLIGADGNLYFQNTRDSSHGSVPGFYRIWLDSSFRVGCTVRERFADNNFPHNVPPHTLEWYLGGFNYWEIPDLTYNQALLYKGFSIVRHFDWEHQRTIHAFTAGVIPGIDTSVVKFEQSGWSDASFGWSDPTIGPCNEIYMHFGFAHREERVIDSVIPGYGPVFHIDTTTWWARQRGGWYRLDTAARTFVHLARVWTPLGISYATETGKIYYGLHTPDSLMSIWEMDRCGRNKRQVTFPEEDPYTYLLSIEGEKHQQGEAIELWPIPVREATAQLRFPVSAPGKYILHISDLLGREVMRPNTLAVSGAGSYQTGIDVRNLVPGIYFVTITPPDNRARLMTTMVIQR